MSPLDSEEKKTCDDHNKRLVELEVSIEWTNKLLLGNLLVLLAGLIKNIFN